MRDVSKRNLDLIFQGFHAQDGPRLGQVRLMLVESGGKMEQVCSKLTLSWCKWVQRRLKLASSCFQVRSKTVPIRPSWAKLAPIWLHEGPSGWQDGHKYAQVDPKMGEVGTKTDQMRLNLVASGPRLSPVWSQECMKADIARR